MLLDLIRAAITDRIEHGATGITLSGGLDSSTVACLAPQDLPTFSAFYDVDGFDERRWSRLAAHPDHTEVEITPQDIVDNFDAILSNLRPPWQGPGAIGQFIFARRIRELRPEINVLLSGEGSDELFGGYARTMLAAGEPLPEGYEHYVPPADYPVDDLEAALEYDYARLPDLLAVDDQMAGPWGLEPRAPFTDDRIVNYALALPAKERVGKRHLRRAVRGVVPDEIIDRKNKLGFPIPFVKWSHEYAPLRNLMLDRLGYLPDPAKPFGRGWWYDACDKYAG